MLSNKDKIIALQYVIGCLKSKFVIMRQHGICHYMPNIAFNWWIKQRPSIFTKFWWNKSYCPFNKYWWTRDQKGYEQRIKYLEYLIKKLEKQ